MDWETDQWESLEKLYSDLLQLVTAFVVEFVTPKTTITKEIKLAKEKVENAYRIQFPITLAYAMSVHKVQGMAISSLAVAKIHKCWCTAQLYVAVSRVRRLSDLYLLCQKVSVYHLKIITLCREMTMTTTKKVQKRAKI